MSVNKTVTRHRSEKDKGKIRQAMMQAAGELLLEQGYEGFSLRKVAQRVGFSPGNIYLYFKDKDDLLYSAIADGFRQFGERLEQAVAQTKDPFERILSLGRSYVEFGLENPVHYELMFVQRTDYLFVKRQIPGVDKLMYLKQAVAEAMIAGVIRQGNISSITDSLWALVHGVVSLSLVMPFIDEERTQNTVEEAFRMIILSLKPS